MKQVKRDIVLDKEVIWKIKKGIDFNSDAETFLEYLKKEKSDTHKILFTGLDTAGKSSIILSLQREFSKIAILKPTKGASRRIFSIIQITSCWN